MEEDSNRPSERDRDVSNMVPACMIQFIAVQNDSNRNLGFYPSLQVGDRIATASVAATLKGLQRQAESLMQDKGNLLKTEPLAPGAGTVPGSDPGSSRGGAGDEESWRMVGGSGRGG